MNYLGSMRILIAEDDEVLADGIYSSMLQSGYAVDCVNDGVEVETDTILRGNQAFDLVILDPGLPQLDGLNVLRNLRERNRQIPVIILTARDGVGDRVKWLDFELRRLYGQPFKLPELEAQ